MYNVYARHTSLLLCLSIQYISINMFPSLFNRLLYEIIFDKKCKILAFLIRILLFYGKLSCRLIIFIIRLSFILNSWQKSLHRLKHGENQNDDGIKVGSKRKIFVCKKRTYTYQMRYETFQSKLNCCNIL